MQSYYSVIKNDSITDGSKKLVATSYDKNIFTEEIKDEIEEIVVEDVPKVDYSKMAEEIISAAEIKKEEILKEAYEKAKIIEKEAYENAYKQGLENGYEDGKNEAISSVLPKAKEEAKQIKEEASNLLLNCHNEYNLYLKNKEEDIVRLAINIAEQILKTKITEDETISNMLKDTIEQWRDSESIIIKTNPNHFEEIKSNIEKWKYNFAMQGEIFVVSDEEVNLGNVILEKSSGKAKIGIDTGLEKIKEALLS